MLGNVVRDMTPPDRNGDQADESRGDSLNSKGRSQRRPRRPLITEKGKGRNLKIPDTVFRRLELEAIRLRVDNSKLVTRILDRELPRDIKVVVGDPAAVAE